MKGAFKLAWRALVRGGSFYALIVATFGIYFLMPSLIRSDGTLSGAEEMFIRVITGGAYGVLLISMLCAASSFFSNERVAGRLSLSLVRPVSAFSSMVGVWGAFCSIALCVLVCSGVLTLMLSPFKSGAPCNHHHAPILPPPEVAARQIMDAYLNNPQTPEEVRNAPKATVLAFLATKEADRYESIRTNAVQAWEFDAGVLNADEIKVRVRFSTAMEMRSDVVGRFAIDSWGVAFSNKTQTAIDVPLEKGIVKNVAPVKDGKCLLAFSNKGDASVMLRPRKDIELLTPADPFEMNLVRSIIMQFFVISLVGAFGLFLSSGLSRPVAIFTSLVSLSVVTISPSVVDQYPNEFETTWADRFGLWISRAVHDMTKWIESPSPIESLSINRCIEWTDICEAGITCIVVSIVLLSLGSMTLRKKIS